MNIIIFLVSSSSVVDNNTVTNKFDNNGGQASPSISEEFALPKKKIKIMTPMLASILDRTGTTSRNAAYIIAATAISLGHDTEDINISASTIHRDRKRWRRTFTLELKNRLQVASKLIVHFDGKILKDIVGTDTVDRIPVVVSGLDTSHLLGAPKITSGSAENQTRAIIQTLREWNLLDRVKGLCFDTTSVNTGILINFLLFNLIFKY